MPSRVSVPGLLTCAALIAGSASAQAQSDQATMGWRETTTVAPIGKSDRLYGKATAEFSLIVWLDPECPYCKVLGQKPEHVVDASSGRVNLTVRLYPLPFHGPNAVTASTTALCVGDQAGAAGYYKFLDGWLAQTSGGGKGIGEGDGKLDPVARLAAASGARNRTALAACTVAGRTTARLAAEMHGGELAGIEGTPAIAVRDNRHDRTIVVFGAVEEEDMRNAIAALRQEDDHKAGSVAPAS